MPKQNREATTLYTSFDSATADKLQSMAKARGQTNAEFVRAAVLDYMKRLEKASQSAEQRELALAEQLKKSTERICSLLAKTAIDINLVARYIWETADDDGQEMYTECHQKAIKRVRQKPTRDEDDIAKGITE